MAYGYGKDFLIKMGDGGAPEVFTTIAGLKSNSLSINNEAIDVTNKDNAYWRQMISGGIKSLSISGSGVMKDAASIKALMAAIVSISNGDIVNFQVVSSLGYKFQGAFLVQSFEPAGDVGKEETYSFKLESSGDITFTPMP